MEFEEHTEDRTATPMNGLSRNNSSSDLQGVASRSGTRAGTPQPQRSRGNPLMRLGAACDSSISVASAPPKPKGDWDELFAGCKTKDEERRQPVVSENSMARGRSGSNVTF